MIQVSFDNAHYTEGHPAGTHLDPKFHKLTTERWTEILKKDEKFQNLICQVAKLGTQKLKDAPGLTMVVEVCLYSAESHDPQASTYMNWIEIADPALWMIQETCRIGVGTLTHASIK